MKVDVSMSLRAGKRESERRGRERQGETNNGLFRFEKFERYE